MAVEVVAGLSLKNLKPAVWEPDSPYYLPALRAVMVSFADFMRMPSRQRRAMDQGLHDALGIPSHIAIYLDNGAFYFLSKGGGEVPRPTYETFVREARPDWYAVPQDYIPMPRMSDAEQLECLRRTMEVNRHYWEDGFVPIVHISRHLDVYLDEYQAETSLRDKPGVALGGIVPNLLRAPKAMSYEIILSSVLRVRTELAHQQLHVFGMGGTATLHLAALLGVDSVDSSGWRNRAARGIVQLLGRGDRSVADLGSWRGRAPSAEEWELLSACPCPACVRFGHDSIRAGGIAGFCHRATHNLWTLLEEARVVEERLTNGTYADWYEEHLDNSIYLTLIRQVVSAGIPQAAGKAGR